MTDKDEQPELRMTSDVAAFIDALNESYPHRCIQLGEDVIEAHRYAAVRQFIDELLVLKQEFLEGYDEDSGDVTG